MDKEGGLDVDFTYDSSDYVKIDDSQESTIFDAFKLFEILEELQEVSFEDFWNISDIAIIR